MPEVRELKDSDCTFIYTDIGRGHPFYLDGIIECLQKFYPEINYYKTNVFLSSHGTCLLAWKLIRWLYRFGAKGGLISPIYSLARRFSGSSEGQSLAYRLLGRDLYHLLSGYDRLIVVAHPILAKILSRHHRVIYQHGELACPNEAVVRRCEKILVPWESTSDLFKQAAIPLESITVTGQCIENDLITNAEQFYQDRQKRLQNDQPLTVALFSSGAYPATHLQKLLCSARSLLDAGHKVIFFAGVSEKVANKFKVYIKRYGYRLDDNEGTESRLRIISSRDRHESNQQVATLFESFDLFLAPAHERTNWAVGLGIPQVMLCPHIGSYAPLNAEIALGKRVAVDIPNTKEAIHLAEMIDRLRKSGELAKMSECGWAETRINGFREASDIMVSLFQRNS